jgi:hypothetical protein
MSERDDDDTVPVRASEMLAVWRDLVRIAHAEGFTDEKLSLACLTHEALTTIADRRAGNLRAFLDAVHDLEVAIEALTAVVEQLEADAPLILAPGKKLVM